MIASAGKTMFAAPKTKREISAQAIPINPSTQLSFFFICSKNSTTNSAVNAKSSPFMSNGIQFPIKPPMSVPPTVSEARLSTALLGQRPDIMALRARAEAGRLRVKAARAAFYPDLKLSAFIGLSAQDIGDLLKRDASILGVLPAITLPIFNSGALRSQLSQEEARYAQAVENYNQTVYDALRDTADALSFTSPCPELGEPIGIHLMIHDHDDLRGALKPGADGQARRGDASALAARLAATEAPA